MDPTRFDTISKMFARRKTRRGAIAGGLSLAAASVGSRAFAQEATPAALPDDPHPSADAARADPEFLFVQPFDAGTWAPKDGEDGVYTLTLTGAAANTVYFSDRPERIVGLSPTQDFLDGLGFTPENPPNAAVVATDSSGEQDVLVIELHNPRYDADAETLTYDATVLADYGEHGLAHLARQQQDYELDETFGAGSLFIDDCPTVYLECSNDGGTEPYGYAVYPLCWSAEQNRCVSCAGVSSWQAVCAKAWPTQCTSLCDADLCDPDAGPDQGNACTGPCKAPIGGSC